MKSFLLILIIIAGTCNCAPSSSNYKKIDEYVGEGFKEKIEIISVPDPKQGFVNFVDNATAISEGLFKVMPNNSVYIGVDSTNKATGRGRNSINLQATKYYNQSLFIMDFAHMPASVCGVWPSFILYGMAGQGWPTNGEIHIVESFNTNLNNLMSLKTGSGCVIDNSTKNYSGHLVTSDCFVATKGQTYNQGCQILATQNTSYGAGFNEAGGGVYALDWTTDSIRIWHFPRHLIPSDILNEHPKPETWSQPLAMFSGNCKRIEKFHNQGFSISTTFCGDTASNQWGETCESKGPVCKNYVRDNPQDFKDVYWLINSIKVYSKPLKKPPQPKLPPPPFGLYIGIPSVIIALILIGYFVHRQLKKIRERRQTTMYSFAEFFKQIGRHHIKKFTDPWQVERERVIVHYDKKLGAGAFADVFLGKLIGDAAIKQVYKDSPAVSKFCNCEIAVKVLPPFSNEASKYDFQKEINFMKSLKHHNHLICLLGYVPDNQVPLLLLEYCKDGDLLQYIKLNKNQFLREENNNQTLKTKTLISFGWQIANGLNYFTSLGFVHRDVAARNVLLSDNVCKLQIGDFGLCRTADSHMYKSKGGKLPVRWMSIEALTRSEYSMKSDVWSYGILLFELFSLGLTPYAGMDNMQIMKFLDEGQRLSQPICCSNNIYELMVDCWRIDPKSRPSFNRICARLTRILEEANIEYNYVDVVDPAR